MTAINQEPGDLEAYSFQVGIGESSVPLEKEKGKKGERRKQKKESCQ